MSSESTGRDGKENDQIKAIAVNEDRLLGGSTDGEFEVVLVFLE
jgi:hypothetical protein